MSFSSSIDRSGAQALMPEEVRREIIQHMPESSAVMRLGRQLPNMSRAQLRMPILAALPQAYFVSGDTGLKKTTEQAWANKFINAEELAVIVPIPINVLDDSDYPIWPQVQPLIVEAMGAKFDRAVLYGEESPANWPTDILTAATSASHVVSRGDGADLYDELLSEDGVVAHVEEDGYAVTGHVGALRLRSQLRGMRDANGHPLFTTMPQDPTRYVLDGMPIEFPRNGGVDPDQSLAISGEWDQLFFAIRRDIDFQVFREGVVQDGSGNIIYNLMQQDMVALRVTFRLGWELPNPINRVNEDDNTRFPFAALVPAS